MMTPKAVLGTLVLAASTAACTTSLQAQTTTATMPAGSRKTSEQTTIDALDARIEKLETIVAALQAQLATRGTEATDARKQATLAEATAEAAARQDKLRAESTLETLSKTNADVAALQGTVADLSKTNAALTQTIAAAEARTKNAEEPTAIHFLGIDLKPGGFLAAESVNRQRAIGGDINTQFSAIPFTGQTAADFSEFNGSGRQSRISLLAEGKLPSATLRGYYEADFLSAGTTSNSNQSNSFSLRQRQVWAQAQLKSGLTFTGGQMWSLATEYGSGLTNTKEQVPLTIDPQYTVGFSWERQYGFRVTRPFGPHVTAGFAVEQAQTLNIGGHNLPAIVFQQAGNAGGLFNPSANDSYNYAPDLIAKIVYEPRYGHFELFGVGRFFRARVFPNAVSLNGTAPSTTPTAGAYTAKAQGGGIGLNGRIPLFDNKVELGAHILAGDGVGRYGTALLPDATEHADGSLELLTGGSALASLKWMPTKRLDVYGYYGGEYAKRAYYSTGLFVTSGINVGQPIVAGYGAPTNNVSGCNVEVAPVASPNGGGFVPGQATLCTADNRNIQEGTFGYWFRFFKSSKGTLQQGFQYSYVVRHTWQGIGSPLSPFGASPKAIDNMWFTSFRYYLPQ